MIIGVPCERTAHESRVGLTPSAAGALVRAGHPVLVMSGAGEPARFGDDAYREAGASIAYSNEEVAGRADLLLKVSALSPGEVALLHSGQTVLGFHHLAAVERSLLDAILDSGATLIGCEIIEDERGDLHVLRAMSEIAGQLAVHVGAHYLETHSGGRGILLGGAPGIPPAHVVILGAGVVGLWAARVATGNMAQVTILDRRTDALRRASELLGRGVVTELAHQQSIARAVAYADVLIGAVLIRGERTSRAVSHAMVEKMKPGSVIVDVSIDQGGCVETSRPTTLNDPVFVEKGVTHYCVPNMASAVARTASLALTGALLPSVRALAGSGIESALAADRGLAAGTYVYRGHLVSAAVARSFGVPREPLDALLGAESLRPVPPVGARG
jgi:alanine dehydrogenase